MLELLASLRGLGLTVIATLHDLSLAAEFAERLLRIRALLADGPPETALSEASIAAADVQARLERPGPALFLPTCNP